MFAFIYTDVFISRRIQSISTVLRRLYNQWFQFADLDNDGVLSGSEAVGFFQRSGLPRNPTLFKVWQYVAGERPSLSRQEFYTAMKLVSAAQQHQGVLDEKTASVIVNGLAGPVPPPKMEGMPIPESMAGAGEVGSSHIRSSRQKVSGSYPLLAKEKAIAYQTAFDHLDLDKDGYVKGSECFEAFMRSGLSKSDLKKIWDVVAGNDGALNRHQFIQSMYLIDCTKANHPIPAVLPPGNFPPVEGGIDVQKMLDASQKDIYTNSLDIKVPPKAEFVASGVTSHYTSILTPAPKSSEIQNLTSSEQAQLEKERKLAEQKENDLKRIEDERAAIASRLGFFTQALAELRMSESKISRGLVEAEQRIEMERRECSEMEQQYDAAYAEFNTKHAQIGPVLKTLEEIETEKANLLSKKAALESAIESLENYDPEYESKGKDECEVLRKEISQLVVRHAAMEKKTEAVTNHRDNLIMVINDLKERIELSTDETRQIEEQIEALDEEKLDHGNMVVDLLKRLAPLYTKLYSSARDALIPLPNEALVPAMKSTPLYKYDPAKFGAYTEDWHNFEEEEGFSVATIIPVDDRLKNFISPSVRKIEGEGIGKEAEDDNMEEQDSMPEIHEGRPGTSGPGPDEIPEESKIENPVFEGHVEEEPMNTENDSSITADTESKKTNQEKSEVELAAC